LAESSHFLKSAGCTIATSASANNFYYRFSEPAGKIVCVPIRRKTSMRTRREFPAE
jgi:hypothetical protein